jgi:hypothetical protein
VQNLRFLLAAAGCALCACNPEVLLKIYPGGTVVLNRKVALAPGAASDFGIETAAAGDCPYVEGLESVQLVEPPRQGAFTAVQGVAIPYRVARNLHEDCTHCAPGWRILYQASLSARGVDFFSFDYHSTTGCVLRYNYVVYIL